MANRQTRRFYKKQLSVKFLKGVDFSHQGTKREPLEIEMVSFPFGYQKPTRVKNRRHTKVVRQKPTDELSDLV